MTRPVIVLGGGGHARVVVDTLRLLGIEIAGVTDPRGPGEIAARLGVPWLGDDPAVFTYTPNSIALAVGVGGVRETRRRRRLFEKFKSRGYGFQTVIHPAAVLARDIELSEGVQVMAGVVVNAGAAIGPNTILNTRASIDHECRIGAHVHIAPGVTLSSAVDIGDGSHIGTGATIIQGVRVGSDCLVGAGAVVLRDIPDRSRAWGNPAQIATSADERSE